MNNNIFLPFSIPCISQKDIKAVVDVLRSGWITTGPKGHAFEEQISTYTTGKHTIVVTSATAAMHLVLLAYGIGPGDEVITPSMTWCSTANLITLQGAKPIFVDINPHTLMTSAEHIAPYITSRTKMIIPVHFAGAPLDLDPIRTLARKKNIVLIEDAAHAIGTEYKGKKIGHTGTALFSFHPIKNITTGEGGAIVTDNGRLAKKLRILRFHGLGKDAWLRYTKNKTKQVEVLTPGYKYNLPDMQAALGITQLEQLDTFIEKRAQLANCYTNILKNIPDIHPLAIPSYNHRHTWHLYIVQLDKNHFTINRDQLMNALKDHNIGTGLHFKAVHLHKYYRKNVPAKRGMLPNTEWASERILSLPLHPLMRKKDVLRVTDALKHILEKSKK